MWRIALPAAIVHAGAGSVHDLFSFLLFCSVNMELTSQAVSQLLYYFVEYSQVWKCFDLKKISFVRPIFCFCGHVFYCILPELKTSSFL